MVNSPFLSSRDKSSAFATLGTHLGVLPISKTKATARSIGTSKVVSALYDMTGLLAS